VGGGGEVWVGYCGALFVGMERGPSRLPLAYLCARPRERPINGSAPSVSAVVGESCGFLGWSSGLVPNMTNEPRAVTAPHRFEGVPGGLGRPCGLTEGRRSPRPKTAEALAALVYPSGGYASASGRWL